MQEWRYKNAVKLEVDDAAQHGLQPGALVLASTLSGMPASLDNVLSAEHQTDAAQEVAVGHLHKPSVVLAESRCGNKPMFHSTH